jgi:hypothetical protein
MPRRIDTISGKVKVRSFDRLDSDRYQYLELSQAEPNLGSPDSDNALVSLLKDGTRLLTTQPILSGLTFKAESLDSSQGRYLLSLKTDPFTGGNDSVGIVNISSLLDEVVETDTLETVTGRGNSTTNPVTVGTFSSDSATISGDLKFALKLLDNSNRRLIIYDSSGNVLWG